MEQQRITTGQESGSRLNPRHNLSSSGSLLDLEMVSGKIYRFACCAPLSIVPPNLKIILRAGNSPARPGQRDRSARRACETRNTI